MHFSPDGKQLVGVDESSLFIVEVATGMISRPLTTNSGVYDPDWSPDGRTIAYFRISFDYTAPPDSSGLHLLDLTTGNDRSVVIGTEHPVCHFLRYAPDGHLACEQRLPNGNDRVIVFDPDFAQYSVAYDPQALKILTNVDWYWRPSAGVVSLVFWQSVRPAGFLLVNPDGSGLRTFPHPWTYNEAMSPDGLRFVTEGEDPVYLVGILDVQDVDDLSGATRRHITRYLPPPASTSLSGGPSPR
jgi:hypothetical protein